MAAHPIKERRNKIMCGIVGYVGAKECTAILVNSLTKLEYRGYDSAGIAVFEGDRIKTVKAKGKLKDGLIEKLSHEPHFTATAGIGHTRWATHGEPSDINSHPIGNGRVSIVHNGIIENYRKLKEFLISKGYGFESQTDTEAVAKLLDYNYDGDPIDTIIRTIADIEGAYSLGIMFREHKNRIFAARKESPLIVGKGKGEMFIASDVTAIIEYTREYYLLEPGEVADITADGVTFYDMHKNVIEKELQVATWDVSAAEKGGYAHFMLKEICEQPDALKKTINPRIKGGMPDFSECGLTDEKLRSYRHIYIVGCGSAMHAGMVGKYVIEKLARTPVVVDIASEFRYLAGPEISVCSTKAYMVQAAFMYLLAFRVAYARNAIDEEQCRQLISELSQIPSKVQKCVDDQTQYQKVASKLISADSLLYIGRGLDYALSMEGSLKLKEISYIHSESYAAGELKHGTISLIEDGMPVIAVATQHDLYEKTMSNIKEVKTRGATVVMVCSEDMKFDGNDVDYPVMLPLARDLLMPLVAVVPLQLIAYYTAALKNFDVDHPRNLAKSVTVE